MLAPHKTDQDGVSEDETLPAAAASLYDYYRPNSNMHLIIWVLSGFKISVA